MIHGSLSPSLKLFLQRQGPVLQWLARQAAAHPEADKDSATYVNMWTLQLSRELFSTSHFETRDQDQLRK